MIIKSVLAYDSRKLQLLLFPFNFRLYILYNLPKLKFLDFSPFKESDRQDAAKKGPYLKVARPSDECFRVTQSPIPFQL